jgi:hypothetical protein
MPREDTFLSFCAKVKKLPPWLSGRAPAGVDRGLRHVSTLSAGMHRRFDESARRFHISMTGGRSRNLVVTTSTAGLLSIADF